MRYVNDGTHTPNDKIIRKEVPYFDKVCTETKNGSPTYTKDKTNLLKGKQHYPTYVDFHTQQQQQITVTETQTPGSLLSRSENIATLRQLGEGVKH